MKKTVSLILSVLMVMSVFSFAFSAYADDSANEMLTLVNNFRTGSDAWYMDKNGNKVQLSGLKKLQYDVNLEKIAKIRAQEVAEFFDASHKRPDGSDFYTCTSTDANGKKVETYGENMAKGQTDAKAAFDYWCETDKDYAGQGHRRNMLGVLEGTDMTFATIGVASFKKDGVTYWVQEFGFKLTAQSASSGSSGSSDVSAAPTTGTQTPVVLPAKTKVKKFKNTGKKTVKVTWKKVAKNNTGYEVWIATDKKFKKNVKKAKIAKVSTTSKAFKKVKVKKTYYAKVRCYKKVGGKLYYSDWSAVKSVKVKK